MISRRDTGIYFYVDSRPDSAVPLPGALPSALGFVPPAETREASERANALVRDNLRFVWRLVRRLGLRPSDADDATQRTFFVAVQRIAEIERGAERAFLYRTAVRMAFRVQSSKERRREVEPLEALTDWPDPKPSPEDLLDRTQARELLDQLLESMPLDLKIVFVLFEIEHLTTQEIATTLGIPRGTAASRLRRARADFEQRMHRLEARRTFSGGPK